MRIAHDCMRKGSYLGTALRKTPAYGCDTATRRTSSLRGALASRVASLSHSEWWITWLQVACAITLRSELQDISERG